MNTLPIILLSAALAGAGTVETETEMPYSENDLYVLSHIISAEAGNCQEEMMLWCGSVVLNRVEDDRFPDTIYDVVFQTYPSLQYGPIRDGSYYNEPTEGAVEAAKKLLEEGSQIPENCIFQADFVQGDGVYESFQTIYGTTYICYG